MILRLYAPGFVLLWGLHQLSGPPPVTRGDPLREYTLKPLVWTLTHSGKREVPHFGPPVQKRTLLPRGDVAVLLVARGTLLVSAVHPAGAAVTQGPSR